MISPISPRSDIFLQALQNSDLYDHEVRQFELIETHISWVLLTGPYAYKIKKPVKLGFLDFSTLEQRCFFCEEELRLNQRLAPEFYLGVITITGSPETPSLNGSGDPFEYAVKMKQFPQEALLSQYIQKKSISSTHIDEIATCLATFHDQIAVADPSSKFGTPDLIRHIVIENFQHMPSPHSGFFSQKVVNQLKQWTEAEHAKYVEHFEKRKVEGFIRECHGDLHLGNIALVDDEIVMFDCIEFNETFRWIDVMSELAFVVMDLMDRGAFNLAWRLFNAYLEQTGDYEGVTTFRFYLSYRAMVRAKVTAIRLAQQEKESRERSELEEELGKYLALATSFTKPPQPILILTHGFSGSGKTTVSQFLLESLGAIRIRSDIERKRLLGMTQSSSKTTEQQTALVYSQDSTHATYTRLERLARTILQAGHSVIVDATFLKQHYRKPFVMLALELGLPFFILGIRASEATLRKRIEARLHDGRDASEADISVLEEQLSQDEPFSPTEQPYVLKVETEQSDHLNHLLTSIQHKQKSLA